MQKQAFQDIARHFAESSNVRIVFEDGATPSTDGTIITLPTELSSDYLDEVLGALLHETNHIRYSTFDFENLLGNELEHYILNFLEDIRVDNKALQLHPNSKCFYTRLIDDVIRRKRKELNELELPHKKIKAVLLKHYGIDPTKVFTDEDDVEEINEFIAETSDIIDEVKVSGRTRDLLKFVPIIIELLFGKQDKDKNKQQDASGKGAKDGQGQSNQQEGQGSSMESNGCGDPVAGENDDNKSQNGQPDSESKSVKDKKLYEMVQDYNKLKAQYEQKKYASQELYDTIRANQKKLQSLKRSAAVYRGKYIRETDQLKRDKFNAKRLDKIAEYNNLQHETVDLMSQYRALDKSTTEKPELHQLNKELSKCFSQSNECNFNGFTSLDKNSLINKNYSDVKYTKDLIELVKEVLILKQEELQQEETGKLNTRNLADLYTNIDNLFQEKEEKQIKTRVTLLVDTSGSMGNSRNTAAMETINYIASAFKKAVSEGAPGEMSLYGFNSDVHLIFDDITQFTPYKSLNDYYCKVANKGGYSTNLSGAVNHVINHIDSDPECKNIMLVLTDAEVDNAEINKMTNTISTSDVRVLYIGIECDNLGEAARELFEDNVESLDTMEEVVERVLFKGLRILN